MTKENRFKGLMGAVNKDKNVQTSKNLDAQTSSTSKKTTKNTDVETERGKKASEPTDNDDPPKASDVQTSKNLDVQKSEILRKSNISTSKNSNVQTSKAKSTNPDYTRTTLYLPKKMHKKLKAIAVESEREMSQIVEELLDAYLESK